jgi:hypothetical protein
MSTLPGLPDPYHSVESTLLTAYGLDDNQGSRETYKGPSYSIHSEFRIDFSPRSESTSREQHGVDGLDLLGGFLGGPACHQSVFQEILPGLW